ncbi:hypothetical protein SAMN04487894_101319 [Niabella drilacis]|uniref:Uncharacterized protein n=1 Tax=Niabella drilacis (strain DSM 25811 / CCM 8410 / CCUG 62505 / LMG 26954 / E90) TaxID=1285928 RepID=A0A1G6IT66_NIADE|nr:hypothetical protein SAMN04487894_101319 [Niabella drilacis]
MSIFIGVFLTTKHRKEDLFTIVQVCDATQLPWILQPGQKNYAGTSSISSRGSVTTPVTATAAAT